MTTRQSLTNRGSNLISAMNQMTTVEADRATDGTSLLGEPHPSSTPIKGLKSKLILASFSVLTVAALLTLILVLALKKSDDNTTSPVVVPCAFYVPYTNWVNYGLNGTGVTCPTKGQQKNCTFDADCLSLSALCVPGTRQALSCQDNTCSVISSSLPDMLHPGGVCNTTSDRPTCARCTTGPCDAGVALCVRSADCTNTKLSYQLECHDSGHSIDMS